MKQVGNRTIPSDVQELLDPERAPAMLLIDVQNDFAHPEGHFARAGADLELIASRLPAMRACVDAMRAAGVPILHLHQSTLPDGKSDSDAWLHFKTRSGRAPDYCLPGTWGAAPLTGFEPLRGETVIRKFRPDAFLGTGLEIALRSGGHQTVIAAGLYTEGCVESTVRTASYRDHYVVVAEDAVASAIAARHDASLDLMRARYAVLPSKSIADHCRSARESTP